MSSRVSSKHRWGLRVVTIAVLVGIGCLLAVAARAADAPTGPGGEKLVPLEVKFPRPLFQGTPKNIKASPTMEKYSEKPRAPFYVPKGMVNLALKKPVTSSDSAPIIGELSMATDGDKEGYDGSYVELGPDTQWLQVDLGKPSDICAIVVWHYHAEGRVYHDTVIQVSDDPEFATGVQTVYNNDFDNSSKLGLGKQLEYIDDFRGKLIDAKTAKSPFVRGRYVRFYSKGNTSNDLNHYVEVEIFGKPAE